MQAKYTLLIYLKVDDELLPHEPQFKSNWLFLSFFMIAGYLWQNNVLDKRTKSGTYVHPQSQTL